MSSRHVTLSDPCDEVEVRQLERPVLKLHGPRTCSFSGIFAPRCVVCFVQYSRCSFASLILLSFFTSTLTCVRVVSSKRVRTLANVFSYWKSSRTCLRDPAMVGLHSQSVWGKSAEETKRIMSARDAGEKHQFSWAFDCRARSADSARPHPRRLVVGPISRCRQQVCPSGHHYWWSHPISAAPPN